MRFGSCPEFIGDCYGENAESLEGGLAWSGLAGEGPRGAGRASGSVANSVNVLEEDAEDVFGLEEEASPFIGAGQYSGFAGGLDPTPACSNREAAVNIAVSSTIGSAWTDPIDTMAHCLQRLDLGDPLCDILSPGSTAADVRHLLQRWCLEGPFDPEVRVEGPRGPLSIATTVKCTLSEWNALAAAMKIELETDPQWRGVVENSPMKRYYGELYPNNGRDRATAAAGMSSDGFAGAGAGAGSIQRDNLFA